MYVSHEEKYIPRRNDKYLHLVLPFQSVTVIHTIVENSSNSARWTARDIS
jgi:hypothetical protein